MSIQLPIALLIVLAAAVLLLAAVHAVRVWRGLRGGMLVTCPETAQPAAVRVDARHAALSVFVGHAAVPSPVRLLALGIARTLRRAVSVAGGGGRRGVPPHDIARQWYAGRRCVYCGKPISDGQTLEHHAALLAPDGSTVEWTVVPPLNLTRTFRTHRPVCWDCHVTETLPPTVPRARRRSPGTLAPCPAPREQVSAGWARGAPRRSRSAPARGSRLRARARGCCGTGRRRRGARCSRGRTGCSAPRRCAPSRPRDRPIVRTTSTRPPVSPVSVCSASTLTCPLMARVSGGSMAIA